MAQKIARLFTLAGQQNRAEVKDPSLHFPLVQQAKSINDEVNITSRTNPQQNFVLLL
jgi:hypothetical protein